MHIVEDFSMVVSQDVVHIQSAINGNNASTSNTQSMERNNEKLIERFKRMNLSSFAGATDPILSKSWIMEL